VEDVLDDLGGDRRDLHDLVPDRTVDRVRAAQRRVAGAAAIGVQLDAAIDLLGLEWLAGLPLVPGLSARLPARWPLAQRQLQLCIDDNYTCARERPL